MRAIQDDRQREPWATLLSVWRKELRLEWEEAGPGTPSSWGRGNSFSQAQMEDWREGSKQGKEPRVRQGHAMWALVDQRRESDIY